MAILFLMFQAVFAWAQVPMDLIKGGFAGLGGWAGIVLPEGWLLSFVREGVISGLGSVLSSCRRSSPCSSSSCCSRILAIWPARLF